MSIQKDESLLSAIERFGYYESLGHRALDQVPDNKLEWKISEGSNSMANMVAHMHGNMMSRWTDFLTSDGEKEWRKRDEEFTKSTADRDELMRLWSEGWTCLFNALDGLGNEFRGGVVYIRKQPLTVIAAVDRQLTHYAYHVGQMVFLAKIICGPEWKTLSIAPGNSKQFTQSLNSDKT